MLLNTVVLSGQDWLLIKQTQFLLVFEVQLVHELRFPSFKDPERFNLELVRRWFTLSHFLLLLHEPLLRTSEDLIPSDFEFLVG